MKQKILKHLLDNQGEYISGEKLGALLQVSRTAVWKQIKNLKNDGYPVISSSRRGYCLSQRADILSAEEIKIRLKTELLGQEVSFFEQVDSTNELIRKLGADGAAEGLLVIAEQQLRGKGRLGRQWVSPAGAGLWFSLLLRPPLKPQVAPQLSLVCAAAVCQAIRSYTGLNVTIKWPNDLVSGGRKICGILTELNAELDLINYVVMGIGINVNQQQTDFSSEIRDVAVSLAELAGHTFHRIDLLCAIIDQLEKSYREYLATGFSAALLRWRELCSTLGQEVSVHSPSEEFSGLAVDIDEQGRLLVRTSEDEIRAVIAGDVSLRRKTGLYT